MRRYRGLFHPVIPSKHTDVQKNQQEDCDETRIEGACLHSACSECIYSGIHILTYIEMKKEQIS